MRTKLFAGLMLVVSMLVGFTSIAPSANASSTPTRIVWASPSPRLDQGAVPACETYASMQQLNMLRGPKISQRTSDIVAHRVINATARTNSSDILVVELGRVGVYTTYRPINSANEALQAVSSGPIVVALPFYSGMNNLRGSGQWLATGSFLGMNHGVVMTGYDLKTQRVYLLNQWGRDWGKDGGMWVSLSHFRRLWAQGGYGEQWTFAPKK